MAGLKSLLEVARKIVKCYTKEGVEQVFIESGITDPLLKVEILQTSMNIIETHSAPANEELTAEEEYQYELDVFMDGTWRLFA